MIQRLDALVQQGKSIETLLSQNCRMLHDLTTMLDGFTSSGSSFRAYQLDPMVVAYAAILGPILGDRIDGEITDRGPGYLEDMMKGAAVMAKQLLRTLDAYQAQRGSLDYLETVAGDIKAPEA